MIKIFSSTVNGLNCVPPQKICWSHNLQYLKMWPCLEIESLQKEWKMSHIGVIQHGIYLYKKKRGTETLREKMAMWQEAETGVMYLQTKDSQRLPENINN